MKAIGRATRKMTHSHGRLHARVCGLGLAGLLLLLLPAVTACQVSAQGGGPGLMAEKDQSSASSSNAYTEVLVRFQGHVPPEAIEKINNSLGVKVVRVIPFPHIYVVQVPSQMSATELVVKYTSFPEVRYAEPNYALKLR